MHITSVLISALFAASQVAGRPAHSEGQIAGRSSNDDSLENIFSKRAEVKPVQCGPSDDQVAYGTKKIKKAVKRGKAQIKKEVGGVDGYPKGYGANDPKVLRALPSECKNVKLYEWPILEVGSYTGGEPGPDRVVINEVKQKDGSFARTYCLTMTHRGQTDNSFGPCPASKS